MLRQVRGRGKELSKDPFLSLFLLPFHFDDVTHRRIESVSVTHHLFSRHQINEMRRDDSRRYGPSKLKEKNSHQKSWWDEQKKIPSFSSPYILLMLMLMMMMMMTPVLIRSATSCDDVLRFTLKIKSCREKDRSCHLSWSDGRFLWRWWERQSGLKTGGLSEDWHQT